MADGKGASPGLLEVRNLKKYYDITSPGIHKKRRYLKAVDDIDFSLSYGETLGIVGESGCGKSTIGNTIIRLLKPTSGEIYLLGENFLSLSGARLAQRRKDIQIIFQDPFSSLNPRLRVFDIIAEPFITHHMYQGKKLENAVYELMGLVGLDSTMGSRFPHEFSGGQRQRIGIARALALHPKLIICDEPVSALDVSIQAQIINLLIDLQKRFNLAYIFIAHGLPTVKYISNRIAVMYLGRFVELSSTEELFRSPLHPYTVGLLSAVPLADPEQRETRKRILLEGEIPSAADPPDGCHFHVRCRYATLRCRTETPELREICSGHSVRCHYPLMQN
ncbi:MAG: ATP-binding cassette domain-containing protein [Treponema sp.]|jgi:peptide/nickel transport system ATP-binding protein|nr:ATP-binding cassette domain-containing protein [Treponema sp.]